jgi:hypothetical protein
VVGKVDSDEVDRERSRDLDEGMWEEDVVVRW